MDYKIEYRDISFLIPKDPKVNSTHPDAAAVWVEFFGHTVSIRQYCLSGEGASVYLSREQASVLSAVMAEIDSMIAEADEHNAT